ncbi:MAG TPA: electron transfer flavoprotein subunit alpha/FixB family protein, partial [Kribbella sp.]
MSNVLVLVDHAGGKVRKTTAELLTIARRLGEPVAVYIGDGAGVTDALPALGQYGATKVIALT